MADPTLPLAESLPSQDHRATPEQEAEIGVLVERFYAEARRDPTLGPIFTRHVEDWDAHFASMRDFWSAVVYRTGRYSGRPFETHLALPELRPEHFPIWLELWRRVVDELIEPGNTREAFKESARRMAASMSHRLGFHQASG